MKIKPHLTFSLSVLSMSLISATCWSCSRSCSYGREKLTLKNKKTKRNWNCSVSLSCFQAVPWVRSTCLRAGPSSSFPTRRRFGRHHLHLDRSRRVSLLSGRASRLERNHRWRWWAGELMTSSIQYRSMWPSHQKYHTFTRVLLVSWFSLSSFLSGCHRTAL